MTLSFGQFLVEEGLISSEDHETALHIQNKNRLLAEIAQEMNCMTRDDVNNILDFMAENGNVQFGEAAVSLGIITANELRYLLDIRTRRKVQIGDILVKNGFMDEEALHKALMSFNAKKKRLHKILVAEESPTIARVLETILTKYDYQVFKVKSGKQAMKVVREMKPDILISGGLLEDMKGIELCRNVISDTKTANINMIMLSSDDSAGNIQSAFEMGVNHFLKKPVKEKELINVIYQIEKEISEKRDEKILIADDSRGARMIIYKELAHAGYLVHQAENGREAVEMASEIRPDIITLDLEMPYLGGFEACRILKENPDTADIPVIIISSSHSAVIRERGFEVGAVEFFAKPFEPGRLADYVNILLESRKIRKNEKILVAEDSSQTRHIFRHIFGKNGYRIYDAKNGIEALEMLPELMPDLIVTDCFMPEMDGFEFTREVKKNLAYRHIPIIMVTGAGSRSDILKGLAAGASDYIVKPFDEAELIARAGAHLLNKSLYDEMAEKKERLEIMNDQKNRLLGVAAHDLRNPISSISGFANLLQDDFHKDNFAEISSTIRKTADELLVLIDDLLDISTIESGSLKLDFEPCDIMEVASDRVKLFEMIAKQKDIAIDFENKGKAVLPLDRHKIQQVIDNLLSNSIKFNYSGKKSIVTVEDEPDSVTVKIRDEGPGIPEEEQKHLFTGQEKISVRPTAGERSTGFGLVIAAKIVKAHGGQIGVESAPGEGSEFYFTLPKK